MIRLSKLPTVGLLTALFLVSMVAARVYADDTIKLGSILILSGEGSSWGTSAKNGIDMAVEKINDGGGVLGKKLTVNHQDDHGDPKTGISAFRQLTEIAGVQFIIGPSWSNVGLALTKMAETKKIIMISPSLGLAAFNESNKYLFNTWPHDELLSEKLADYVYGKEHHSVAVVGAEEVWVKDQTAAFRKRYEALGGKIAYLSEPLAGTVDLKPIALKITKLPEVQAFVATSDGAIIGSLVAKILRDLQFIAPMYSITLDQASIDAAQGGFEGLEFLTSLTPTPEFKAEYEAKYKTNIDIGADSAFDAVMMLASAIRGAGSTNTDQVAAQLASIKDYHGVSGHLVSDGKRAFQKQFAVKKIVGGKPVDTPAAD